MAADHETVPQKRTVGVGKLVQDLTRGRITAACHLDPDLNSQAIQRMEGWRRSSARPTLP